MRTVVIASHEVKDWGDAIPEVSYDGSLRIYRERTCIAHYVPGRWDTLVTEAPRQDEANWKMIAVDLAAAIDVTTGHTQGAMHRFREALEKS